MNPNESRPGDGARGAAGLSTFGGVNPDTSATPGRAKAPRVFLMGQDGPQPLALAPRTLWALRRLIEAGARGVSTLDNPAPRWSAYVHTLRGEGVLIETEMEPHAGAYPGHHARYRLHSRVRIEGGAE